MAAERAPTMATTIHAICRHDGQPGVAPGDWGIARGEQGSGQRKRQREHGVLELDHLEDRADASLVHWGTPNALTQRTQRKAGEIRRVVIVDCTPKQFPSRSSPSSVFPSVSGFLCVPALLCVLCVKAFSVPNEMLRHEGPMRYASRAFPFACPSQRYICSCGNPICASTR